MSDVPHESPQIVRTPLRISVVIPTLNEAAQIGETIVAARLAGFDEIVVVDGGSQDDTVAGAHAADRVLASSPGRAAQQNAGACAATGDVVFFLHADCRPHFRSALALRAAFVQDPGMVAGCFTQQIAADGAVYRWLEWGNLQRVLWLRMAYGDQGLFVRRELFHLIGRFPDWPLMEDVDFQRRLSSHGRFVVLDCPLAVSARRWQKRGVLRQTLRNWTLLLLFRCGVSPERLARFYSHVR